MSYLPPRIVHPQLDLPNVLHGFFTRIGGVSEGLYGSLNTGAGSQDDAGAVLENRRRVAAAFDRPEDYLITLNQVHSTTAFKVDGPWPEERPQGDALVTSRAGVVLSALSADCAPILFADPQARVIGSCHAGWKGALGGVIESTLKAMAQQGAKIERIRAVVGPCIQQPSYEVGAEYEAEFLKEDKDSKPFFMAADDMDKRLFDLPGYCLMRLKRAGAAVAVSTGHDTCAQSDLFFSNRRAVKTGEADYGRLISCIMIRV
ncbi:peptidoglycan editing factor PgeF [Asticcacaulis sp. EMRT-3]|uniref:peptidoglycan editing factor PgeF n=1 Tax=Asticcacaulis sp. EMRT-3 TaxID=3040349 RepID=UPI0024AF6963|nr:peptidoglycan editing factor PgeF [Asticcacaulis sp. EMRT-3]MDI7774875.1 peptidoglycan editing factor PgeF [Asticcacaulis sp. EMRT-3]